MGGGVRRRVVVTGLGCVTPLGNDAEATWQALLRGESGIAPLEGEAFAPLVSRVAGSVKGEVDAGDVDFKERRRLDRVILFALAAAREAAADAGFAGAGCPADRVGVAVGSAIGGLGTLLANHEAFIAGGARRVSPFAIPMALANMPGAYVAIKHGLRGPNFAHVSACASGAHAIGEAARAIERGDVDAMFAGGAEATTVPFVVAAFANMQALSRRNDEPQRASRPFDLDRDGFVMGEGAGILVLEAEEHARARGARIRAEILGYGASADAQHIAAPDEEGAGARACLARALRDAGIAPGDVHYVNAHATSTPAGDKSEARALRAIFGAGADSLPVSATKSMTGHLLGAAGAVEALICVRALETGTLPPTINLDRPDPECALDHVAGKPRAVRARVAVSNSFGFGGTNSSLVIAREGA
jgi:3-oxoacyl-[acyl-carrier-protein] synthase II